MINFLRMDFDVKEREDPSWKGVRRSFAPAFGTVVQVLKKKKLPDGALVNVKGIDLRDRKLELAHSGIHVPDH